MKTLILAAVAVIVSASPAVADRQGRMENPYRACVNDYGKRNSDWCLENAYPTLSEDRAILEYLSRGRSDDKPWHRGECWSNPKLSSRASCLGDGREDSQ